MQPSIPCLAMITLLVTDYDEAADFFTDCLGFELLEDVILNDRKRWVVVAPAHGKGAAILLAKAEGSLQLKAVGAQAGGRVGFFLNTDDFNRQHEYMLAAGVRFLEAPRHEAYGIVAVFLDLYGNKWDLIQPVTS